MLDIPAAIIPDLNALSNTDGTILLVEIQLPTAGQTLRLARNTENVSWDGEEWVRFPFELDDLGEGRNGEVPQVAIRVSNVNRAIQSYIEEYDGGVDGTAIVRLVHGAHLDLDEIVRLDYTILGCHANSEMVTFTLGTENMFAMRFPQNRILKNQCRWRFKDSRCGYAGGETTCNKTLARCRDIGNSVRFGGFPGTGVGALVA